MKALANCLAPGWEQALRVKKREQLKNEQRYLPKQTFLQVILFGKTRQFFLAS